MDQQCRYQELDVSPKLIEKEAAKRPTATLKELQEFLAVLHVPTCPRVLHMSGLRAGAARRKPFS